MRYREITESRAPQWVPTKGCKARITNGEETIVWVDVAKLDAAWRRDGEFYIAPNGEGGIRNRYQNFGEWLKEGHPVEMPEVDLGYKDLPAFTNGRHRFAWFRDNGVKTIPVVTSAERAAQFKSMFGANVTEGETLELPNIEVGDEVLVGKFKNRKATVKGFKKDDNNQPVLKTDKGDQKLFKPRIAKLMKEDQAPEGYPLVLKNSWEIGDYIEGVSDGESSAEEVREYLGPCKATLHLVPIAQLQQGDADHNIRNARKEKRFLKMNPATMPPIVVENGTVLDGNHRLRVATALGLKAIWCYVIED